jgi:lipopolysaccharide biosynthesis protein
MNEDIIRMINLSKVKLRSKSIFESKVREISFIRSSKKAIFFKRFIEKINRRIEFFSILNSKAPSIATPNHSLIDDCSSVKSSLDDNNESFVLPFKNNSHSIPGYLIAIHAHIFYESEIDYLALKFMNIPKGFSLYISTDTLAKQKVIQDRLPLEGFKNVVVKVVENRGRDIAPLLLYFPEIFLNYKYILHVHTKKSPHNAVLSNWYSYLIENLVGSPDIVNSILSLFEKNPSLGMIAPEHFSTILGAIGWGGNHDNCTRLLSAMGVRFSKWSVCDFPSGSMFWAKVEAFKPLLDLKLSAADFDDEAGQIDGTLAHAIERLFFYSCEVAGYRYINTIAPTLQKSTYTQVRIQDPVMKRLDQRLIIN